jgi:hypothetical protein
MGQRGKTGLTGPAGESSSVELHLHVYQTDSPEQEAEQSHAKSRKQEAYTQTSHDGGGPVSLKVHVVWWQMLAGGLDVNAISHPGEL